MTDYCDDAPGNLVEDRAGLSFTWMFLNWGLADLWGGLQVVLKGSARSVDSTLLCFFYILLSVLSFLFHTEVKHGRGLL
jgi:hypothetical protein